MSDEKKRRPYKLTPTKLVIWFILAGFLLSIVGAAVAIR